MGMTKEEWENPTWVEKDGVRFYYAERKDPTLTQMTQVDADPPVLDVEITLFNERMEPRDAMTQFTVVGSGRVRVRPVSITMTEPVTRESAEKLLDTFLEVRRLLTTPTEKEALYLLGHDDVEVRRYARNAWFKWLSRWTKESMNEKWDEMLTPDEDTTPDIAHLTEEELRDEALRIQAEVREQKRFSTLTRLSGDGRGNIKDPDTGEALTEEEAAQRLRDALDLGPDSWPS